jgi:hypothetical protein
LQVTRNAVVPQSFFCMGRHRSSASLTQPKAGSRRTRGHAAHPKQLQHRFAPRQSDLWLSYAVGFLLSVAAHRYPSNQISSS